MAHNPSQSKPPQNLQIVRSETYSGILPPPAMLEHYDKIVPGSAERLIKMAENQSQHRMKLESQVIHSDSRNSTIGVISALIITVGTLVLAGYAIKMGQTLAGGVIGSLGIASIVGAFIYGTRSR